MELVDNIQEQQACKFPRINGNGRNNNTNNIIINLDSNNKIVPIKGVFLHDNNNNNNNHHHNHNNPDEEEDHSELLKRGSTGVVMAAPAATDSMSSINRLRGWNSSRIIRVSRASGGKDRHSKVLTSKGLRDRRVRLSVSTAIQFYDLQDRLGYDQPSKAVEWLIKAASDAINELPSLNTNFPDTPKQLSSEKRGANEEDQDHNHHHEHVNNNNFDSMDQFDQIGNEANHFQQNQQQQQNLSKSACSSTSDTSKGSGLSLSRSEIRVNRVKARERARKRAAKEKDKDQNDNSLLENVHQVHANHPNLTHQNSASSSFTELLIGPNSNNSAANSRQNHNHNHHHHQWHLNPHHVAMDYFNNSGQTHLGIGASSPLFTIPFNHGEMQQQHFSFVNPPEQQVVHDYNLNFTIASSSSSSSSPSAPGLAAGIFNRGTLQSNISPSSLNLPHFQRLISSPIEGSSSSSTTNVPSFFIGATPTPSMENSHHHHHHPHPHHFSSPAAAAFDARLQLCYGDGTTHSNQKGKGKN